MDRDLIYKINGFIPLVEAVSSCGYYLHIDANGIVSARRKGDTSIHFEICHFDNIDPTTFFDEFLDKAPYITTGNWRQL
jgi:hypothetical protein